jgi:outer membrane lipoprotein-sorting protein
MDARALLEAVAEAYASLNSFEVEILSTTESGDADSLNRRSQRARAFFAAPDKVRIEESGRDGTITVTDGVICHHYFRRLKQYMWSELQPELPLAGSFRPAYPFAGTTFLFHLIAESVANSEILREEPEAYVVSVTYDRAAHPGFSLSASPVTLWIDRRTRLVLRVEVEMAYQFPGRDESHTSRNVYTYEHAFLNQSIPPQTFEYMPPADAVDQTQMPRRGGCGSSYNGPDEKRRFDAWHTNKWAGDAFEEEFELTIRDIDLRFERRLSFVGKDLLISEKIIGPQGPAEHQFSIPVA